MTTDWTKVDVQNTGFGPELVPNSDFSAGSVGWTVGTGWTVTVGSALHTPPNTNSLDSSNFNVTAGPIYTITTTIIGGTNGTIQIFTQDNIIVNDYLSTPTDVFFLTNGTTNFSIVPSSDFDGILTEVSIKEQVTAWIPISNALGTPWSDISKALGTSYTDIPKPSGGTTVSYGTPYGMLLALLRTITVTTDDWTKVPENGALWTDVPKAT